MLHALRLTSLIKHLKLRSSNCFVFFGNYCSRLMLQKASNSSRQFLSLASRTLLECKFEPFEGSRTLKVYSRRQVSEQLLVICGI